jgi:hypothetical protein
MVRRSLMVVAAIAALLAAVAVVPPPAQAKTIINNGPDAGSVAGINLDGRLEIVRTGPSGQQIEHAWQTAPGGTWSKWDALPGITPTFQPTMIQNADGRLEIFVATDGGPFGAGIVHAWQLTAGGGWSNWDLLVAGNFIGPNVARNANGVLQVFFQEESTDPLSVMTISQQCPGCPWGSPTTITNPPVVESWGWLTIWLDTTGRLNVISWEIGRGGTWYGQAQPGGPFVQVLSDVPLPPVGSFSQPLAGAMNVDGTMQLFLAGSDKNIWTVRQTAPLSAFGSWTSLGGDFPSNQNSVVAAANADGRLEVVQVGFATGYSSHLWQTSPGGSWASSWEALPNQVVEPDALAALLNADGRLEVFLANVDNRHFNTYQVHPSRGPWSAIRPFN